MRRTLISFLMCGFLSIASDAQQQINPATQVNWVRLTGSGAPSSGLCSSINYGQPYTDVTNDNEYFCTTSGWLQVNGSSSYPGVSSNGSNGLNITGVLGISGSWYTANSESTLRSLLTSIGGSFATIQINAAITLTTGALTIPNNVALVGLTGGSIDLAGYNADVSGPFISAQPGFWKQSGAGRVYFEAGSVKAVNPAWIVTSSSGSPTYDSCQSAINAAAGIAGSTLSTIGVEFSQGASTYSCQPFMETSQTWAPRQNSTAYAQGQYYTSGGYLYIVASTAGIAAFTGSISSTTLTVTAISSGSLAQNQTVQGTGVASGTYIAGACSALPVPITCPVSVSQTVGSESMTTVSLTGASPPSFNNAQDALTTDLGVTTMTVTTVRSDMATVAHANIPAFIEGNNVHIQTTSTGLTLFALIQAKDNLSGSSAFGAPTPVYRNIVLDGNSQIATPLFWLGSPGNMTNVWAEYGTGVGIYSDSAVKAGTYYNTFIDMNSVFNGGAGFYETGQSFNILTNNANTWIHAQSRHDGGWGWEDNIAENDHFGSEIEDNSGGGVHIRGVYTNTLWSGGWAEANYVNGVDIGFVVAGEPTNQGTSAAGINGLNIRGMRTGLEAPWITWQPNATYALGVNVIPPANSTCTTSDLCFQQWAASTSYNQGNVTLSKRNFVGNGRWYMETGAGPCTSGTSEPQWPVAEAATIVDGGCTWTIHALAYQIYPPNGAGTSGSSQPPWSYTPGATFNETLAGGTAVWQVQAQNIIARNPGNDVWGVPGNAGGGNGASPATIAPSMGPGGDLTVQSLADLSPMTLLNGSTGATQTPGENTNLVATDNFANAAVNAAVIASGGGNQITFAMPLGQSQNVANLCNTATCTTSEGRAYMVAPAGLVLSNLQCTVQNAPPGSDTIAFTFRSGNTLGTMANALLACTISSSGTTCSDANSAHDLTINAGKYWDLGATTSATSGSMFWACSAQIGNGGGSGVSAFATSPAWTGGSSGTWTPASAIASLNLTATHGTTYTLNVSGLTNGGIYTVVATQDATGGGSTVLNLGTGCTWFLNNSIDVSPASSVTITSNANNKDYLQFGYDGTNCLASYH